MNILENESLSKYTTFHLGGAAKYFVVVKNAEEIKEALAWAKEKNLKYFILGGGSNLLFGDDGFDGLIIKIAIMEIEIGDGYILAGAGTPLLLLVKKSAEAGLSGLESFSGIPGTIGGAVCGNAGAYGKSMSDVVEKVEMMFPEDNYKIETVDKSWFEYRYRGSKLKYWEGKNKPIISRVWLKVAPSDKEASLEKVREIISVRVAKEPRGFCAGCAFKNFKGPQVADLLEKHNFSPDEKNLFGSRGAIPAAWFIDRAGLKGKKIGGAYVPDNHANYVMNDGMAKAGDVIAMISFIKQQVREKFGVQLEEELEIVI